MLARCRKKPKRTFVNEWSRPFKKGLSQTEAARVFAVARGTVSRWMGLVKRAGRRALKARRRGRPPVSRLAPQQAATTVRYDPGRLPDSS